jgi:leader peptidase (prepilin peptidase)/N-methyltransferase
MFPLIGISYFAATSIPLVIFDLKERRLPNKITVPGLVVVVLSLAAAANWAKFGVSLLVGTAVFLIGLLLSIRGWIGMGDVKLFTSLGMLLAWFDPLLVWQATFWTFLTAGLFVVVGYLAKKITAQSTLALGPYLLIGFWVAIIQPAWSSIAR